jgi:hypothetical protein
MVYEINSDYLSHDSRQHLVKILAEHFAGEADALERERRSVLRQLADSRQEPDAAVLAGVEADKTPYVPGQKGRRRVVALNPTPKPLEDADCGTSGSSPEPSSTVSEPKPRTGFLACLRKWLKSFHV